MNGSECVQVVAEEILKGHTLSLSDPLTYSGISIVPIVRLDCDNYLQKQLGVAKIARSIPRVIIGSFPSNTCGVFVLDSLGDVLAFKLHQEISAFWKRIEFVESLVMEQYKETRKPLNKASVTSIALAFLMRLKMRGPEAIMNSDSDYFAVSRTDMTQDCENINLFTSTLAVLYCAASQ